MNVREGFAAPRAMVRVVVDGVDYTDRFRPRLNGLRLTEKRAGEADQVDIGLADADGLLAIPPRGALIRIGLGWERGTGVQLGIVDKGSFRVDEAAHAGPPDVVTITGRSADLTADFARRRDASYLGTTLGAVVDQVAKRHGYVPQCAPALADLAVPVLGQSARSDMALLRALGRRHDAVATVKAGALILSPIGAGLTATGRAIPGATIARRDCARHTYRLVARDDNDGVEASWHDQDAGERKTVAVGGTKKPRRIRRTFATEADARQAAEAQQRRQRRAEATLELDLSLGRANLYPDREITVSGFKPEIDARRWLIVEIASVIDDRGGYVTAVKLESNRAD